MTQLAAGLTITYEQIKEAKEKQLDEDYKQQLKEFAEDRSYYPQYDPFTPFTKRVLVKIFKFIPKIPTDLLGQKPLMIVSPLDGQLKPQLVAENEKVFPIVKVIKVGLTVENKEFIKPDGLYTVPVDNVVGDDWNPEFTFYMNTMITQGKQGGHVKIPEGMRQRIPKLEKNWDKYKFGLPTRLGKNTEEDDLIYLIPEPLLESVFTL